MNNNLDTLACLCAPQGDAIFHLIGIIAGMKGSDPASTMDRNFINNVNTNLDVNSRFQRKSSKKICFKSLNSYFLRSHSASLVRFGWKCYTLPCSSLTGSVNDAGCSASRVSHFWFESSCYVGDLLPCPTLYLSVVECVLVGQ